MLLEWCRRNFRLISLNKVFTWKRRLTRISTSRNRKAAPEIDIFLLCRSERQYVEKIFFKMLASFFQIAKLMFEWKVAFSLFSLSGL